MMHRTKKQAQEFEDHQKLSCPTADAASQPLQPLDTDSSEVIQDGSFIGIGFQVESQSEFDYLNDSSPRLSGCPQLDDDSCDQNPPSFSQVIADAQAYSCTFMTQQPAHASLSNLEPLHTHMSTLQHKSNNSQILPIDHEQQQEDPPSSENPQSSRSGLYGALSIDLDNIFKERPIERSRNITKAIRKYLERHLSQYQSYFQGHKEFFKKMKKEIKDSKKKYFSLQSMTRIFIGEEMPSGFRNLPRLVIRKILNRWLRKSIIPNNQVKDKLTYLVATKVYALRCSNEQLSTRVQMR